MIFLLNAVTGIEPRHDKTNRMNVRPAKTQISLDLRWAHSHFVGFVMSRLNFQLKRIVNKAELLIL